MKSESEITLFHYLEKLPWIFGVSIEEL
uniref:Uncharacterized protein n=1 Tax=Arundo donax TaxID=35708 RepID=A0A0A9AVF5_ARUDO